MQRNHEIVCDEAIQEFTEGFRKGSWRRKTRANMQESLHSFLKVLFQAGNSTFLTNPSWRYKVWTNSAIRVLCHVCVTLQRKPGALIMFEKTLGIDKVCSNAKLSRRIKAASVKLRL